MNRLRRVGAAERRALASQPTKPWAADLRATEVVLIGAVIQEIAVTNLIEIIALDKVPLAGGLFKNNSMFTSLKEPTTLVAPLVIATGCSAAEISQPSSSHGPRLAMAPRR